MKIDAFFPIIKNEKPFFWLCSFLFLFDWVFAQNSFAPESMVGRTLQVIEITDELNGSSEFSSEIYFTSDKAYFQVPLSITFKAIDYSYSIEGPSEAKLSLIGRDEGNVIHEVVFSSLTKADSNWTDDDTSGYGTLEIVDQSLAPSVLSGSTFSGTHGNEILQFIDSKNALYYDPSVENFSEGKLLDINYSLEQVGPRISKVTTNLGQEILLFYTSSSSGYYYWKEATDLAAVVAGQFDLESYTSGFALKSLVGSSMSIGGTTFSFLTPSATSVQNSNGTTLQEYLYLRYSYNEAILSVGSSLYRLNFYSNALGKVTEGTQGDFSFTHNWANKGWVFYSYLPWVYSNNQGDWFYQMIYENVDSNTTKLAYFQPWRNLWNQTQDINFTDRRVFSSGSELYWDDYEDFSGSELNSSKWGVGFFAGGQSVSVVNGQAVLSGLPYDSSSPTQMPDDLSGVADSNDGNTFLFFNDEDIYGIQADISIPSQTNEYDAGIYLASLDINPLGSLGAELRYQTSGSVLLFDYLESGNELKHQENGSLDTFYQLQIIKVDGKTSHYLNGNLIKQFESSSHDEDYWTIGAFNDAGLAYTTYADNVRVLRKKTYPKGWMWTEYYPWAYSYETGGWLYFELAKDTDGNPVLNYYDHSTGSWDLYGPSINQFAER